jgi:hypothetical protein
MQDVPDLIGRENVGPEKRKQEKEEFHRSSLGRFCNWIKKELAPVPRWKKAVEILNELRPKMPWKS